MNHLIFSAVLTACLRIGGHQYTHQHGPYNKPPNKYVYEEPAQLNSSETYSWPMLVLPRSTQHVAICTFIFYVLTYFAGNFGRFNVHTKVFRWMMVVYPIVTALTGFQVANLIPYLAKILPHFLGLYSTTEDSLNSCLSAAKLVPMKTHAYKGNVTWLTEVGEGPTANLPRANTGASESTLEALESNPDTPKTTQVTQSGQEPTHLLNCIPKLLSYSETYQSP
ncbi:hypothetical protein DSO57_1031301 [Entomophthora muscae]|uniref:Uncharacterized protein n=1 Tax=Entomophthora muscae TaxID=34485 RepID=A0ACC2TMR1_9FUNG|nr:hypothetical protein DSO57_1031301 [Entomophthora muscae]